MKQHPRKMFPTSTLNIVYAKNSFCQIKTLRKYYYPEIYSNLFLHFIKTYKLKNNDRLFFSKNKKVPLSENSIRTYLNKIEKENNFEHITPHGLRHRIASYLYSKGISWKILGNI